MEAFDLIMLGRQLTRIGERAMRGGPDMHGQRSAAGQGTAQDLPPGSLLVMRDVFAHPGSSISDITARTGLPQSYVSDSVSKLREHGMAETSSDPADGRRTLVSITAHHLRQVASHSLRDADAVLLDELGDTDGDFARQVIEVLSELAARLRPPTSGSAVGQIRAARPGDQQQRQGD